MSRIGSLLIALFMFAVAVFPLAGGAKESPEKGKGNQGSTVLFAVFGSTGRGVPAQIEPILILEGGNYKEPVSGGSDMNEITRFSNANYRRGQKYRLLFGGAEAGTVTVTKSTRDEECFRTGANVTLQSDARLNRNVMALATNSQSLGAGERSRRSPTQAERSRALELARAAYRQKGVPASLLTNLQVINLTAIDLDRDGKWELAGSFVASKRTRKQERYALFLLALPQGENYRTAVANYSKHTEEEIMSGATINIVNEGVYVERLVDHIDLDGDRISELVTTSTGLEGVGYNIYRRQNGEWKSAYEFANYRCAF